MGEGRKGPRTPPPNTGEYGIRRHITKMKRKRLLFVGDRSHPQIKSLDSTNFNYAEWQSDKERAEFIHCIEYATSYVNLFLPYSCMFYKYLAEMKQKQEKHEQKSNVAITVDSGTSGIAKKCHGSRNVKTASPKNELWKEEEEKTVEEETEIVEREQEVIAARKEKDGEGESKGEEADCCSFALNMKDRTLLFLVDTTSYVHAVLGTKNSCSRLTDKIVRSAVRLCPA